ncbi:Hypothetical protein LBF_3002 [Leptospira biflexa serovar Patoc strain 'Patoc 1 (Ames)']|uniref:Uncharacterized protein n=2 Tax=Leptospira biflexa TaxID=172 RepID=B0SQ25_LEPBP|nr:Hypothetical protein LBF_3002 [Leptospira biflexa serovar Patoc strain 'Patoc 1 (Ames)']ABZ99177.1 Hypothetical protein; putative signal peptide [Leptospira biflexa serovar Patoc strain 'Patoc 1 (Paris)']
MNKLYLPRRMRIKYTLLVFCLFLGSNLTTLLSKETDNIHEKPQLIDPDNHRIYFSYVLGAARGQIPEKNLELTDGILFGQSRIYQLSPLPSGNLSLGQFEIEYRYKDRYRIFADNRTIKDSGDYKDILNFKEYQKRAGIGYFHPIFKVLSLGVSIRDANIKQDFRSDYINLYTIENSIIFSIPNVQSQLRTKGWVPGIHLEFKPLRWFEIHLGRMYYHMGGDMSRSSLNFIPTTVGTLYAPLYMQSDFLYSGVQDKFDVVFRYSTWFATKWGYTRDNINIKFNQYYMATLDNQTSLLMSAIGRRNNTKLDFDSVNFTVEFSKSFGEDF